MGSPNKHGTYGYYDVYFFMFVLETVKQATSFKSKSTTLWSSFSFIIDQKTYIGPNKTIPDFSEAWVRILT